MTLRVLVGFDGTEKDAAAILWALEVGPRLGASIEIVHALGLLESSHRMRDGARDSAYDRAREQTEATIARTVESAGLDMASVRITARPGDPVLLLLQAIDDNPPDLVVLGHRVSTDGSSRNGSECNTLGSVSREVVGRATVPVVVVPQQWTRRS